VQSVHVTAWLTLILIGLMTMSFAAEPKSLRWEGAADRKPTGFLIVTLTDVAEEGGGLFGIRRSPSFADALPDAHILEGSVENGPLSGSIVRLRAPGAELPDLHRGDRAAFGMVSDQACICVLHVPPGMTKEQLLNWLAQQRCGG
jgi:hypothetical protein